MVFFYLGLNFALPGVQEQYNLVPSQLVRTPSDRSVYDSTVFLQRKCHKFFDLCCLLSMWQRFQDEEILLR